MNLEECAKCVTGGIFVTGGKNRGSITNKTEFIDPIANISHCNDGQTFELPHNGTRYGMVSSYLGNEIVLVCGGYSDGESTRKDCYR